MKKTLFCLLLILVFAGSILAGPFGIEMGDSLRKLEETGLVPSATSSAGYYFITPKSTHPDFEDYLVRIDEDEGVFLIKAIGKDISDNKYGTKTKSKFDEIRKGLDRTYGSSELTDLLMPRALWKDLDEWLMSIRQQERFHLAKWDNKTGASLPKEYASIYLAVDALSSTKGYLVLEYYGARHSVLSEKSKQEAASVF